jgi:hypothetical protein
MTSSLLEWKQDFLQLWDENVSQTVEIYELFFPLLSHFQTLYSLCEDFLDLYRKDFIMKQMLVYDIAMIGERETLVLYEMAWVSMPQLPPDLVQVRLDFFFSFSFIHFCAFLFHFFQFFISIFHFNFSFPFSQNSLFPFPIFHFSHFHFLFQTILTQMKAILVLTETFLTQHPKTKK